MESSNQNEVTEEYQVKKRHWLATTWLVLCVIMNAFGGFSFIFLKDILKQQKPDYPDWIFIVMPAFCFLVVVGLIAILKWKKWGFWMLVPIAILLFGINVGVVHSGVPSSLFGLANPLILFLLLKIGGKNSAWNQLQ